MEISIPNISLNLPDFLVVGTAKAGTTSLYQYLRSHPDVFLSYPRKELWFWNMLGNPNKKILDIRPGIPENLLSYTGLFYDAKPNQLCGDVTPSYSLYHDFTIQNLKRLHPKWREVKIIMIFREPWSKIVSQYKHAVRLGTEHLSLSDALMAEEDRIKRGDGPWMFYKKSVEYGTQFKAFQDNFPQTKAMWFDDLTKSPQSELRDLFGFLNLNENNYDWSQGFEKYNSADKQSGKTRFIEKLSWKLGLNPKQKAELQRRQSLMRSTENINQEVQSEIRTLIDRQLSILEECTGKDLTSWKTNNLK